LSIFVVQVCAFAEVEATAALLAEGIAATNAQLCLNADDALVASLAGSASSPEMVTYFGIEQLPDRPATATAVSDS